MGTIRRIIDRLARVSRVFGAVVCASLMPRDSFANYQRDALVRIPGDSRLY